MTSSIPTAAATARAVASLSPVRSRSQAEGVQPLDGLGGGRLDRVGHGEQAAHLAVPRDEHGGAPALLRVAPGACELAGDGQAPFGQQRRAADLHAAAEGGGTRFEHYDRGPWPTTDGLVPLEVKKGALIVLDGLLPHLSRANRSPRSRHAYTLHLIEAGARYPEDNWLRRAPDLPLRGFE